MKYFPIKHNWAICYKSKTGYVEPFYVYATREQAREILRYIKIEDWNTGKDLTVRKVKFVVS